MSSDFNISYVHIPGARCPYFMATSLWNQRRYSLTVIYAVTWNSIHLILNYITLGFVAVEASP